LNGAAPLLSHGGVGANRNRQLPTRPLRKFNGELRALGTYDLRLKIVDIDPSSGDSQDTVGPAQPTGTDMVTGLERKLPLRPLFPNDGLIGHPNHLFRSVSDPHHEPVGALSTEHGAG
jgi:hypothetical protein